MIPPLAVAARFAALRAIDADIRVRKDRIALLRRVRMLRPLPVPAIEGLALRLRRSRVAAQTDVFRKGDPDDGFYVIESGRVAVIDDGHEIRELGPGDAFGEIALLRSVPRTATVCALEDTQLATVSGAQFVSPITGFSATSSAAEQLVSGYLAEDLHRRAPAATQPRRRSTESGLQRQIDVSVRRLGGSAPSVIQRGGPQDLVGRLTRTEPASPP